MNKNNKKQGLSSYFKNLSDKDKVILCITSIIIITILSLKLVIIPSISNFSYNRGKLLYIKGESNKYRLYEQKNKDMNNKIVDLQENYNKALKKLPSKENTRQLLEDIKKIATNNSLSIKSIAISEDGNDKSNKFESFSEESNSVNTDILNKYASKLNFSTSTFSISITGEVGKIHNFIRDVENYERVSDIVFVSIQKSSDSATLNMQINFYNTKGNEEISSNDEISDFEKNTNEE